MSVLQGEVMGRVFDAIKRSGDAQPSGLSDRQPHNPPPRGENRAHPPVPSAKQIEEQLFSLSSILGPVDQQVKSSAFTAHTANAFDGKALPDGTASRAAGATLNAVRPARATSFVAYDVDAARVEPHLVALTQPRSAYCEQFRSLRTRVLQAGEREQMRTFVITSAGMGEGKTVTALNLAWLLAQGGDIVPIPGSRVRARAEENARAAEITLSASELEALDAAVPKGAAAGTRYTEGGMKVVNR